MLVTWELINLHGGHKDAVSAMNMHHYNLTGYNYRVNHESPHSDALIFEQISVATMVNSSNSTAF